MNILRRYFLKEFLRFFVIILIGFTAISTIAEFFDKMSEFYAHQTSTGVIAEYLLLQTPAVMLYAMPFASLFSILITIGIASKWREIVVIKASGNSTRKLFVHFIVTGLILSAAALLLGETVVPDSTRKAAWIRKVKVLKESPKIVYREQALWMNGLDKSLIRIDGFVANENRVLKTSIFYFTPDFKFEKRIEAREAVWKDGTWELRGVVVFDFAKGSIQRLAVLNTSALEEPKIFREEIRKPEEMNFMELYDYYTRLEKAGFKNLKYVVRLYEKLAYPLINFIMVLFGISLSLHSRWGGGIKAAGIGVIVSVVYWLIYSTSISLGNAGVLPPVITPWIGPAIFGALGAVMYSRIRD